jgi:hypothetical protein
MPLATEIQMETPTWENYNGWANYETWNVSLWIQNTRALYEVATNCGTYARFVEYMHEEQIFETGDGVKWNDPKLDLEELDEMIDELHD